MQINDFSALPKKIHLKHQKPFSWSEKHNDEIWFERFEFFQCDYQAVVKINTNAIENIRRVCVFVHTPLTQHKSLITFVQNSNVKQQTFKIRVWCHFFCSPITKKKIISAVLKCWFYERRQKCKSKQHNMAMHFGI